MFLRCLVFAVIVTVLCPLPMRAQESEASKGRAPSGSKTLLHPEDRVALIGGTLVERMHTTGALEWQLQACKPDWKLRVRNLGWSGDTVSGIARKRFDNVPAGESRRLADIEMADPTVAIIWYGQSEANEWASDKESASKEQMAPLQRLLDDLAKRSIRAILVTPPNMPGFRNPGYESGMVAFASQLRNIARERSLALIELNWTPSTDELTEDQLLPSRLGYQRLAEQLSLALMGQATPRSMAGEFRSNEQDSPSRDLEGAIVAKNELFFHQYRPQNETYLFLFRKHEQGNNAVEVKSFDPFIEQADIQIWEAARSIPVEND